MTMDRRSFLKLAGLVAAGASASACTPLYARLSGVPQPLESWVPQSEAYFAALSRMTFGPRVEERVRVAEIGLEGWIEEQLAPDPLIDQDMLRLRPLDALALDADTLSTWERQDVIEQMKQGTLLRQVYSENQLEEIMVSFWTDHFNIYIEKGDCWFLKVVDDREVIRQHALGNFHDLLWASAHSPAMMVYLDNQVNISEAPNENYARELMELHTLGVSGGYSQDDVMELARCLTGWSVKDRFWRGEFTFNADQHDNGVKNILGVRIDPDGQGEAEKVLTMLAEHPSTARFLAIKLVRRFVTDEPLKDAPELVEKISDTYLKTDGDIPSILKVVLLEGLVRGNHVQPKIKRPLEYVVSAARMLNVDTSAGTKVVRSLEEMGQPLYGWPTPDGPPDVADSWSSGLMPRWKFALALARGELPGTSLPLDNLLSSSAAASSPEAVAAFGKLLLGRALPDSIATNLLRAVESAGGDEPELNQILTAGLLSSPAFQWR